MSKTALAITDVSHAYDDLQTLTDINLTIQEGEFVAFVGPSGCGKSTLLKLIAGLLQPTQGEINLYGERLQKRLGRSAYMPQTDTLLPWRKVLENVTLGSKIQGTDQGSARKQAKTLLSQFGLGDFINAYPAELSGGMRQRVALLRTMLIDHSLVLLDEPLSALDTFTRAELQDWLLEVRSHFQRTMILVTHDVEEAVYLSDRVLVFSPRPGQITHDIAIDLDMPRHRDSAAFHDKVIAIRSQVKQQ